MTKLALALAATLLPGTALATTLVTNANGIKVDAAGNIAHFTGLLVGDDGKIEEVLNGPPPAAKYPHIVDMGGRTVLPGLIDAHGHVTDLGFYALRLDLTGTTSLADLQSRLKAYAAAHPGKGWIQGGGWNQELWPDHKFPTAADLDAVVSDRPVILERVDGHAVVANSAAMRAADYRAGTPVPSGGEVHDGLFVDAARGLVDRAVPAATPAQIDEALAKAQSILLGFGVTTAGAMSVSEEEWGAFDRAGRSNKLDVRLLAYALGGPLKAAPRPTGWLYGDHLRLVGVKLFADGALGSRGAWLKQPYADKPDSRGLQFHSDAELLGLADRAAAAGFQLATHAIGDAANAQVIGVYEKLSAKYGLARRWRIEHFQIVDPADIPRLKPAGIIASMQPTHQTSDRLMAEARLGPTRLGGAYAWNTVLKDGIPLAFGSDFPVESPNPFPGLMAAISRQDIHGQPPGGWRPEERISLGQALAAFTQGGAYAGFAENKLGCLDHDCAADFIVVDRDPTAATPQEIGSTKVIETWVGGRKVYSSGVSAAPSPERGR